MSLKPAYGGGGVSVPEGGWTRADIVPGAGDLVVRRGAEFGGEGEPVEISWTPTGDDFAVEFVGSLNTLTSVSVAFGHFQTTGMDVQVLTSGAIRFGIRNVVIDTDAGTWEVGREYHVRAERIGGQARLLLDGVEVASGANATAVGQVTRIGDWRSSSRTWQGVLRDVNFIDSASDANTAYYPLDSLNASGEYPNEHPGSTVGDATVSGTVLPVELTTTTAGSGVPVPVGPVVFMASRSTPFNIGPGSGGTSIDLNTGPQVDPYGWRTASAVIDVSLAGIGVFEVTGRARVTTLAVTSTPTFRLFEQVPGNIERAQLQLTFDTVNEWVPFALTVAVEVAAGSSWRWQIIGINPLNSFELDDIYLTLTLYPDLS